MPLASSTLNLWGLTLCLTILAPAAPAVLAQTPAELFPGAAAQAQADQPERAATLNRDVFIALPLATLLGTTLALRPRRKGTPSRSSPVIQTQIILSLIGALVMLVVGSSLARAFGVVGAAGLVRYRAKIEDPKDAGVMLSTLAVGLACGVGLYPLAVFSALFIVVVLYVVESFEPKARKPFTLEIKSKDAARVQAGVERLFRRRKVKFELRESGPDQISYEVQLPLDVKTDSLSADIMQLDKDEGTSVQWNPEKKK